MILTIGPGGCGFTFLNWSIVFLRGDKCYVNCKNDTIIIDSNPLLGHTAHNFDKDHVAKGFHNIDLTSTTNQSIIYAIPSSHSDFLQMLQVPGKKIIFDNRCFADKVMARFFVVHPFATNPYFNLVQQLSKFYDIDQIKQVLIDSSKLFITDCYDIPKNKDLFIINYNEMFQDLDQIILQVFDFLGLQINQQRFDTWKEIYTEYKNRNTNVFNEYSSSNQKIDPSNRIKILREIINWRNGLYHHT